MELDRRACLATVAWLGSAAGCVGTGPERETSNSESPSRFERTDTPTERAPATAEPTSGTEPSERRESPETEELTETDEATSPDGQPKIRGMQDNFGNTFTFEGAATGSVQVDEEVVAGEDTEVELCVTESPTTPRT